MLVVPRHSTRVSRSTASSFALHLSRILGVSALLFATSACAHAGSVTWKNAASGLWSVADNWSSGQLPGSGDTAQNDFSSAAITFNTTASILSFLSEGAFTITGGTLSGSGANSTGTIQVNNTFTIDGGVLDNFTVNPGSGGQGVLFTSNSGNGISNLIVNSSLTFGPASYTRVLAGNSLNGTVTMTGNLGAGSGMNFVDNGTLTVNAGGRIEGYGQFYSSGVNTQFQNNGTIIANVSGGIIRLDVASITGNGTFSSLNGSLLIGGVLSLSTGSTIETNGGIVQIDGGGLSGTLSNSSGTGLSFSNNTGNLINNAAVGTTAQLTFNGSGYARVSGTNSLSGTITMTGNQGTGNGMNLGDNGTITVNSGGLIQGYGQIYSSGVNTQLQNNGTITANVSGGTLRLDTANITGNGTFSSNNGSLLIGGLLNLSTGSTIATSGGIVQIDGGGLSGTLSSGSGTGLSFSNNTSNLITNATIGTTAQLTFDGSGYARVFAGNILSGTVSMTGNVGSGNGMNFVDNGTLTINSGGLVQGYGQLYSSGANTSLQNNGTITANVNGGTLRLDVANITGSGTFSSNNGSLLIGGLLNLSTGSTIGTNGGIVQIDGGGLSGTLSNGSGTGLAFSNNTSNLISNAAIGTTAQLTFNGSGYARVFAGNSLSGTVTMTGNVGTGNGLNFIDNGTLIINNGGVIQGYGEIYSSGANTQLQNNGTITANVSGGTLRLDAANITGSGAFSSNNGSLLIGGLLNLSSGSTAGTNGGIVQIDGGGLSGTLSNSSGTGLSFSNNTGNLITNTTIDTNAQLTFTGGGYARVSGANNLSGNIVMTGNLGTGNGMNFLDNGTLTVNSPGVLQGYGQLYSSGSNTSLHNTGTVTANVSGTTLSIVLSTFQNSGTINVISGSTLEANTVTQNSGQTIANGTLTILPGQAFSLQGGLLTGTGTISGLVTNSGGTLDAGTVGTAGTLTLNGSYTQMSGGTFSSQIGGTSQGSLYDFFSIGGDAALDGMLQVSLINGFVPETGSSFQIIGYSSHTGQFTNGSTVTDTSGQYLFSILYTSNGIFLNSLGSAAMPEPSDVQFVLMGGLPVLVIWSQRRRRFMR